MTQTLETGYSSYLTRKLEAADTTAYVATAPTVTKGRLFITDWVNKEWVQFTGVSGSTLTGLTRGLSKTADPSTSGTGTAWIAGTTIKLVAMHDQLWDKLEWYSAAVYATTAARDTALWGNGAATKPYTGVYVTATGLHYNYNLSTNQWESVDTGTTTPNASATVAGKLEVATTAQSIAGTDTGDTGALLSVLPGDIAKNTQSATFVYGTDAGGDDTYVVALTPTLASYTTGQRLQFKVTTANTGACSVDFWPGAKSIKTLDWLDPQSWAIRANQLVTVMYDGTNMVLQTEDLTQKKVLQTTRTSDASSWSTTLAHGLSKAPRWVSVVAMQPYSSSTNYLDCQSSWYRDGTNQWCTWLGTIDGGASLERSGGNDASNAILISSWTESAQGSQWGVISADGTNVTITWTKTSTPISSQTIYVTLICHT